MFHVNEAYDGHGTLTVKGGKMTVHITLVSKKIVNLYAGLAADAEKDEANWLQPTEDEVKYDDGTSRTEWREVARDEYMEFLKILEAESE